MRNAHLQMRNAHLQIGMVFTSVHLEMCPHQTTGVPQGQCLAHTSFVAPYFINRAAPGGGDETGARRASGATKYAPPVNLAPFIAAFIGLII